MKVVILCGGLGTRLREETEFRPKPMVEIGGKPIIWHIMKHFAHYGFKEFVLCLGYKGEMIKEYFYNYEALNNDFTVELGNHKNFHIHSNSFESGWRVTLADTGNKALKGARLKRIEKYLDNDDIFMMTYGDGVANVDLDALLAFHRNHGKMATVTGINPVSRFGELRVDGGQVKSFIEKPENNQGLIAGGFYVFNKSMLRYVLDNDECDLEIGALERMASDKQLMVYKHNGFWACMDTLRDVDYLNKLWNEGKAYWKVW